jgi:hypothetical protein
MSNEAQPASEGSQPSTARRRRAHSRDPAVRPAGRALLRWVAPAAVLIAVISLAVAVWALLRPAPPDDPPTEQQIADAKGRACAAYTTVRIAVLAQTNADPGTDPVAGQAVAANARLAMASGGSYLLDHLDPATPPQLAESMRSLAANLQDLSINALAGRGNNDPEQVARLQDFNVVSAEITDQCK